MAGGGRAGGWKKEKGTEEKWKEQKEVEGGMGERRGAEEEWERWRERSRRETRLFGELKFH